MSRADFTKVLPFILRSLKLQGLYFLVFPTVLGGRSLDDFRHEVFPDEVMAGSWVFLFASFLETLSLCGRLELVGLVGRLP